MGVEGVSYGLAIAVLAFVVGGLLFRLSRTERKENVEILERLKTEFFPQLEANLREIQQRLERQEPDEYSSLVMRNLSATLKLEFSQRFENRARRLEQLREDLSVYEKELSQLAADKLAREVGSRNAQFKENLDELVQNVRELSKLEKLPGRLPVVGH